MILMLAIAALAADAPVQDGVVVARQRTLSIEEVMGPKARPDETEEKAEKERRKQEKRLLGELRRMRKGDDPFTMKTSRRGADGFRRLPPDASRY